MSAPGPILGDVVAPPARAPRRAASRPRSRGTKTIETLAEAEEQIVGAARDLAWLAGELGRVTAEKERRGAALIEAREACGRLSRRLADLERLATGIGAEATAERSAADARVREAHDRAAAAIRMAEERASAGLRGAQETVREVTAAHDAAMVRAVASQREAAAERAAVARAVEAEREAAVARAVEAEREAAMARADEAAATARVAAAREAEPQHTARERRLGAELEHLRRERSEHEERLRAELDQVRTEKVELRTRLSICEHALAERERDLDRERKLADEAMRWASSVERELVLPPPAPVQAAPPAGDCAVKPPAADPPMVLRRRGSRVRLRPAS